MRIAVIGSGHVGLCISSARASSAPSANVNYYDGLYELMASDNGSRAGFQFPFVDSMFAEWSTAN
jgi:hypothetical protein